MEVKNNDISNLIDCKFTYDELEAIKIDCSHILKCCSLSKEHKKLRENVICKIEEQTSKIMRYEYEMFFKSNPNDFCKIDGWIPISTKNIPNIDKIEEYISSGLIRRVSCNE